jgi:hypothetical protein
LDFRISSSNKQAIASVVTVGSAILGWEYQTTSKWAASNPSNYGLFSKQRFGDAVAQTFGNKAATQILPGYSGAADFTINPIGALNVVTVTGVALLIADSFLERLPFYKEISPFVEALGWGLTVGGAVGGFFDPAAGNGTIANSPYFNTQTIQNPALATALNRSHGLGS